MKAAISTISAKGQTTVPKRVREHLNLKEGDQVVFEINENGETVLKKTLLEEELEYLRSLETTLLPEWGGDEDDGL